MSGILPLATSLDHAGPLSRCVMDAAFLLNAIAEPPLWNTGTVRAASEIRRGVKYFRIGIPRQFFFDHIQTEVRKAVLDSIGIFEQMGAKITELNFLGMSETAALASEITGDEAFACHEKWLKQRPQDYGKDVRLRLEQSSKTTAAVYIGARRKLLAYSMRFASALNTVDVLLTPTLPITAPVMGQSEIRIGNATEDIRTALLRLTRPGNLSGLPAISIPCGFSSEGLPIGLQLIGRHFEEATLLRAAYAYEQATPWHLAFPPDAPAAGQEGSKDLKALQTPT
jgi:aspartyl-tRNA(Asn)/glutamyl-tRNA(Gln) amidotransferase subunit A